MSGAVPHVVVPSNGLHPSPAPPGDRAVRDRARFAQLSAGVGCNVLIALFAAGPEVVGHGLLDSSLGKFAYTSRSGVSFYTVYTRQPLMGTYATIIYKQIRKTECVYNNNLPKKVEGNYHVQRC